MSYDEFINNILETRGRFACGDEYHERHHIVPKCMGGTNDDDNLIDLFAREHFEAHKLLALENPDNEELIYAWACMAWVKDKNQQRVCISPEEFEEVRKVYGEMCKERYAGKNNPMYGKHHSEEARNKMSKNHGKKFGEDNHFFGKKHTIETRKKMSENNILKKKVICVETGKIFDSLTKAEDYIGISRTAISRCCSGKQITCGGYHWCFLDDYNPDTYIAPIPQKRNDTKSVVCMETKIVYQSINDAERETGICATNIGRVCKGKNRTAGGYHWEYV